MKTVFNALALFLAGTTSALASGGLNTVPEPSTLALVGLAVAGVVAVARKRK